MASDCKSWCDQDNNLRFMGVYGVCVCVKKKLANVFTVPNAYDLVATMNYPLSTKVNTRTNSELLDTTLRTKCNIIWVKIYIGQIWRQLKAYHGSVAQMSWPI